MSESLCGSFGSPPTFWFRNLCIGVHFDISTALSPVPTSTLDSLNCRAFQVNGHTRAVLANDLLVIANMHCYGCTPNISNAIR